MDVITYPCPKPDVGVANLKGSIIKGLCNEKLNLPEIHDLKHHTNEFIHNIQFSCLITFGLNCVQLRN